MTIESYAKAVIETEALGLDSEALYRSASAAGHSMTALRALVERLRNA